ncbi:hypothetical protein AF335_12040 [Streptomyces eurocidicus]|uniref:Glutamate synthase domain-containing protein 1 n=1 Tax=Streptomyces eurocidicus TaxID=66423 RepID=A0A2N8NXS8_STREU|nr:DUF397 domain-containing protein [Streptomyces eurocidicus]MBB5123062.1 glutamate synthase domain-containing protein 1 [Streptomyces eurocidicus]MBF6053853.1 DUF397 domain-containing protein [Streptomyces eurocidicus]PNE33572.1 hypothetical protein AF335_12040 [Streptomyces eurocidicus]
MSEIKWQKSSFSGDRDDCVEVGRREGAILMRESDDPAVVVTTTPDKVRTFILGVKAGALDHLI